MKYLLIFNLIFWGLFIHQQQEKILPPKLEYYLTSKEKTRTAIFKYDSKKYQYLHFNKNAKPTSLSASDLINIEKLIDQRVRAFNKDAKKKNWDHSVIKFPEKYFKQIVPVLNPNGEKEVWVFCSCEVMSDYWKKGLGSVNDGGSCYFQLKINLTKGIVTEFGTNGLA